MKINIICALILGVLALAGCSKDEVASGSASIGDSKYSITSVYADAFYSSRSGLISIELYLVTDGGYFDEDVEFTTDYFFVDLYWDSDLYLDYFSDSLVPGLVEGTYTLGDDVLDEVTFCSDDYSDIEAVEGTLTISSRRNGYSISFSGTAADGTAMNFSYSGSLIFFDD